MGNPIVICNVYGRAWMTDVNKTFATYPTSKPVTAPTTSTIEDTLHIRGAQYMDAWLLTGEITNQMYVQDRLKKLMDAGYMYAWITILCKLFRALATPNERDHWVDIAGYAQLVVDNLDKGSRGKHDHK
jgi:hypothetical protein